ncbi:hypothetical protein TCON_0443 [Astathelohania contejeani]|uniref:Uncharacterized protein n=1 Tax=Astathelohania contejeani TaxID=164912 RepID=A0ABQ7I1U0_9MICR|nr:hypothetical protein TCON_0443 [Thelohania contejeani]
MEFRPRIWKREIESYDLEEGDDKLIMHTLARKIKDRTYKPKMSEDMFYKQFELKDVNDLEMLVYDTNIYKKLECRQLRCISMKLIGVAKRNKIICEEMITLRYNVKRMYGMCMNINEIDANINLPKEELEHLEKFLTLSHDFIARRMRMDTLINNLRERINKICIAGEKDWNLLKRLYIIVNKPQVKEYK